MKNDVARARCVIWKCMMNFGKGKNGNVRVICNVFKYLLLSSAFLIQKNESEG